MFCHALTGLGPFPGGNKRGLHAHCYPKDLGKVSKTPASVVKVSKLHKLCLAIKQKMERLSLIQYSINLYLL